MQFVLEENYTQQEAVRHFGITRGQIQMWIDAYLHHGLEGLIVKNRTYSGDFKVSIIEYMRKHGLSARKTAAEFNITSFTTVCTWQRIYLKEGPTALYLDRRSRSKKLQNTKHELNFSPDAICKLRIRA
ncbi:helix-turn-helix domain-containing protein [Sporomusa sp.]|uniref:helix-turn-helix domain-containing protein n=1 Tax=Sporomusa sp. TaxID=2078658 RepID=UPI0039C949B2